MTLFDTSAVIDARDADSPWHEWAIERIIEANAIDGAAVNTIVVAEAGVRALDRDKLSFHLEKMGLILLPLPMSVAAPAAKAYVNYLERLKVEGKTRASKVPLGDFLIGAHAAADRMDLVTRDPDRVKTYFPSVKLIVPND
jgi:predicted nucleic acid-binding protein